MAHQSRIIKKRSVSRCARTPDSNLQSAKGDVKGFLLREGKKRLPLSRTRRPSDGRMGSLRASARLRDRTARLKRDKKRPNCKKKVDRTPLKAYILTPFIIWIPFHPSFQSGFAGRRAAEFKRTWEKGKPRRVEVRETQRNFITPPRKKELFCGANAVLS